MPMIRAAGLRLSWLVTRRVALGAVVCVAWTAGLGRCRAAEPPAPPKIVFMIGEDEYETATTLPPFAHKDLESRGANVTIIQALESDPHNFSGLEEALENADLLLVSVRRRAPKIAQLEAVRKHVASGRPVAGIRTASHAFSLALRGAKPTPPGCAVWPEFDNEVLGGSYHGHHPNDWLPTIEAASGAAEHPILRGVELPMPSGGSLYEVRPLREGTTPLLIGRVEQAEAEPVAWTNQRGDQRVFYTSLGYPKDFEQPAFRALLVNGFYWAMNRPVPQR